VVGRESELVVVDEFVRPAGGDVDVLVIAGEPGIGKTTLWAEAVRHARENGLTVLAARPAESEAKLAFAGLTDLLGGVAACVFDRVPAPQRQALDVALLRAEGGRAPGRRLVGTALHSALLEIAGDAPTLVAIDDVQWLDGPSAAALEFALRRLGGSPVRVLLSIRTQAAQTGLAAAFDEARVRRVDLGPLSVAVLQHIVADRLGVALSRPTLVNLARASNGNAFYALEIARLLIGRGDDVSPSAPLPVPDDLRALVEARISRLPRATRAALLRAAASARPTAHLVELSALAPAEHAGLVVRGPGGSVEFTHPLFASAVYGSASSDERLRIHRDLAALTVDPEEQARHLALASTGPDESTAAALENAAARARARGAPDTAAELAQLAVELTPVTSGAYGERTLALAEHLLLAGDFQRAAVVLEELTDRLPRGDLRARARLALAEIEYWRAGESAAVGVDEAAARDADDPSQRARCLAAVAMHAGTSDLPRAAEAARAALDLLAVDKADPALLSVALSARVRADLFLGKGLDRAAAEQALRLELESGSQPLAVDTRIGFKLGQWFRYVDDFDTSRLHLTTAERAAVEEGDESSLANIVLNRTLLECWAGNWQDAEEQADRTRMLFSLTGVSVDSSSVWRAYVDAHYGRLDAVQAAAGRAPELREPVVRMLWERALGLAELGAGDAASANTHFSAAVEALVEMGFREPAVWRVHGDAIEAAVAAGDVDRADALAGPFEEAARRSRIPWSVAVSARCRGVVLAARDRPQEAADVLAQALVEHERCPVPFELGRTLLAHGRSLRRLKQKRSARVSLERAAAVFADLGADVWAAKARDELRRTAARSAPVDLSATELRIARLAADGLTNESIAAEVLVAKKTVEANLSRAYRKLGIRSRAQLARALDARDDSANT
jgi:DNA-binding CsgD family transcriptional regulator